jgi:putative ABC transport system substrate-binding protein
MRRREFIALIGGAAAWPLVARGQQHANGVLLNLAEGEAAGELLVSAFRRGLHEAGLEDGRNIRIEMRWGAGASERYRRYADELVALAPGAILAATTGAVVALQKASHTVPIVFVGVIDPIGSGLVASMARPSGNATGFTVFEYAIGAKWLELLREIAPHVTRTAVLRDASVASGIGQFAAIQAVASTGAELSVIDARDVKQVESAVAAFAREPNGGLVVTASGFGANNSQFIATLAARHNLPAVYPFRYFASAGGLVSYGPRLPRPVPPRRWLHRSHPQGRNASAPSGAGAGEIRAYR